MARTSPRRSVDAPTIVVVGSSNTDLVLSCSRLPAPGETVLGGELAQHGGGKGANQAVAARRAGASVTFVGLHGGDDFGRRARAALRDAGVDVRHFRRREGVPSGVALIFVGGRRRENIIGVARSANDCLTARDVDGAREVILRRANVVLCQLEVPLEAVSAAAALAREAGVPFLLNPAPARRLSRRLLRRVHTLIPNEHEARVLTGEREPVEAARELRHRGVAHVVITLGARGALVATEGETSEVRAPRVRPVDTVGAGDCFAAWLAVGLAEGLPLKRAAKRACRAAALAVSRRGAQDGMPTRREVER